MGDKYKSEIQKPVKNTLLSGASHGFPFESFQGSSLLIPVSQDSPSVLNDSIGDVNNSGKELIQPENVTQVTETLGMAILDPTSEEQKNQSQSFSQSYSGLFSSFFGGSQKKQDLDLSQTSRKNSDQASNPRPSSPFVVIPNIQSFSPALQVPSNEQPFESKPTGFSHPSFSQIQGQQQADHLKAEPNAFADSNQQNFFTGQNAQSQGVVSQTISSSLGFESSSQVPALTKAQSAVELPLGGSIPPSGNPASYFSSSQNSGLAFYQNRSGSVDSIQPIQPPNTGMPPPPAGPSFSLAAPPLSSGVTPRNYRRDHHKRLAYAPVPGLTSKTAISSSFLQTPSNPNSLSSSALTSSSEPLRQPLSGSLSQPSLNLAAVSTASSSPVNYPPSGVEGSLPNYFNSHPLPSATTSQFPSVGISKPPELPENVSLFPISYFNSEITLPNSISANVSSPSMPFVTSTYASSAPANVSPPVMPLVNQKPNFSPQHNLTSTVSVSAVQSPNMSPKEQPVVPAVSRAENPPSPVVIPASINNLANLGTSGIIYRPVYYHWFYKAEAKGLKEIWQPFSMIDSLALEQAYNSEKLTPGTIVATDGGRYDVNVTNRIRTAVYWEEEPKAVRRCSWFFRSTTNSRLHPYDENIAYNLEEEYKKAVTTNSWNRNVDLSTGERIIMYGPNSMALLQNSPPTPEGWEAEPDYSQTTPHRPKIVKRGVLDDFEIEDGETPIVDHLIFVVHGIGSVCDFKFRTIEEAVDGFRNKSLQLIKSHFRSSIEQGIVNRVEILPVSWHNNLHGENTGLDKKLQTITLKSIPRLRNFTNDTLLDILFYTSPVYCQNIVGQVGKAVNNLYSKFKIRNPNFRGGVSLVGHSLGSLILFDMLCHQKSPSPRMEDIKEEIKSDVVECEVVSPVTTGKKKKSLSRNVSYVMGNAGTGQPFIEYPQLCFQPVAFFALGSPIGMFVTVRGIDSLGLDFCLPTCSRFFNVFHPFDPVAYRIEALINPDLAEKTPFLIPHHKGRKRMHLELKETMARVKANLKQRLVDSVRSTWNTVYQLTTFGRADDGLEQEVDKVIEKQLEKQRSESISQCNNENVEDEFDAGKLNQGRRIDYVLQEAPLESFNEYVSAVTSHVIYWNSEDTMLLILKEIYGSEGISPDSQVPTSVAGPPEDMEPHTPTISDPNLPSCSKSYSQPPPYGFK